MDRIDRCCSQCVMDTSDSMIWFNDEGICDHCLTFRDKTVASWRQGEVAAKRLHELVNRIKEAGRTGEFDCIVGMSGGIDSSYLLHYATVELGLRPLVFHVDAGWNSQIAVNNIERLVDGLGLELYTEVINWREMRDLQLAFFKSGVPHIDTPQDHAFFATMYRFANKYGVRYILTGGNLSTECVRNPVEWMYYQSDARQLRDIHAKYGSEPLRTFPTTSILWHKAYLPYIKRIRTVRPLDLIPYRKQEAMRLLEERYGWQPYPQKHFESRFTRFYESFWLPTRFGYDVRRVQYSSLILTGQMSREEALRLLESPPYDPETIDEEIRFVADKLEITTDELLGYLKIPKRTFRDFKSQWPIYQAGAGIMKLLGLEVGGKR